MTPKQISLVQESWAKVKPIAPQAAEIFYSTLFEMDPSLKPLFKNNMTEQGNKLMTMLDTAVKLLNSPGKLIPAVEKLGARHVDYGVTSAHYDTVGAALLKTLEIGLGDAFTLTVKKAWTAVYGVLATTMIEAADAAIVEKNQLTGNTMSNNNDRQSAFIQGALEQSGTAFMMIDRDFIITYVNESTMKLLKSHEATFQKKWIDFKADKDAIIGYCIDGFHANPAHQRKMLDDPNNLPYTTDIHIEHLTMELNVTAIMDTNGDYIGNSLEWSDVTKVRFESDRAVQLQGAIDQSNTPSMMIDRDFLITYANKATFDLLKENEATFAKSFPGFSADEGAVIGACIDGFHKNPAHQRKLLDDPNNLPWKTDIHVQDLTFELNVTAIFGSSGEYIGNALEWQNVTEAREKSIEVGRLNSAVEGMTTNLMMADTQGNIVYANPSVCKMLSRREAQIQKVLPSFSVKGMVGSNFDSFHRNPAHQQNLLGNPDNLPYDTEISLVGLTFQLIAIALKDEEGNHVGTAVQWLDLTEEKDAQAQVENMISDAISGQLDSRIETSEYNGFMKGLDTSSNELV